VWWKEITLGSTQLKMVVWLNIINFMILCVFWPPHWITHITRYWYEDHGQSVESVRQSNQERLRVLSWNIQRMGELETRQKQDAQKNRAQCILKAIAQLEQDQGSEVEVFAFQETSNRGLQTLEELLQLSCQFVSYHPTQRTHTGGLGICVRLKSKWKLNYVRKISLRGEGRWRALFAELSKRTTPHIIFNLINVHFLPHQIDPQDITSVLTSPLAALELLKDIQETSITQQAQARGLLDLIKNYQDPTLLMGDFNAPPRAGAHPLLKVAWTDVWQQVGVTSGVTRYFGDLIPLRVDYIYALSGTFRPLNSRVGDLEETLCSDHLPLSAELDLLHAIQ